MAFNATKAPGSTKRRRYTSAPLTAKHAAVPATLEEMRERMDLILEACKQLQELIDDHRLVTEREVVKLRKAYWLAVGNTEKLKRGDSDNSDADDDDAWCPIKSGTGDASERKEMTMLSKDDAKAMACDRALRRLEVHTQEDTEKCRVWWSFSMPLQRRLQILMLTMLLYTTCIPFSVFLTVALLLNTRTMPAMVIYLIHIFTFGLSKHPLKKYPRFCKHTIWRYYRDYFPVRLVIPRYVRRQFDATKNYFFVYHPHGVHSFGVITNFVTDSNNATSLLPGIIIHPQTLKINFYVPFWRELAIYSGSGDASKDCIQRTLRAGPGESVLLVVGGVKESFAARPYTNELKLRNRSGFVKIALQEGSPLVPVYAFGENDVFNLPGKLDAIWRPVANFFHETLSVAIPPHMGRGWFNHSFGPLPHRRPIVTVVGEPLVLPKIPNPTAEDVQEWHGKYIEALQQVFNEHRAVYDLDSTGLCIT